MFTPFCSDLGICSACWPLRLLHTLEEVYPHKYTCSFCKVCYQNPYRAWGLECQLLVNGDGCTVHKLHAAVASYIILMRVSCNAGLQYVQAGLLRVRAQVPFQAHAASRASAGA